MSVITGLAEPIRITARRPTRHSKERELQRFIVEHTELNEVDVQYEPSQHQLGRNRVCSFDLYIPKWGLYLERTEADEYAASGPPKQRRRAAKALSRKFGQAATYMELHPDDKVVVVTNAEWDWLVVDPRRLNDWADRQVVIGLAA